MRQLITQGTTGDWLPWHGGKLLLYMGAVSIKICRLTSIRSPDRLIFIYTRAPIPKRWSLYWYWVVVYFQNGKGLIERSVVTLVIWRHSSIPSKSNSPKISISNWFQPVFRSKSDPHATFLLGGWDQEYYHSDLTLSQAFWTKEAQDLLENCLPMAKRVSTSTHVPKAWQISDIWFPIITHSIIKFHWCVILFRIIMWFKLWSEYILFPIDIFAFCVMSCM